MAKRRRKKKRKINKKNMMIFMIVVCMIFFCFSSFLYLINQRRREQEETPIESNLIQNTYLWNNLKKDGSFMSYEDDTYTSLQGVDVSSHQEWIDWEKVKNAGIDFAYLRVGYRGWQTGEIHKDAYFDYNIQACQKYGIKVGVYFFSQATSVEEAREEAEFTLQQIKSYTIDLPVCFDIEQAGEGEGRVDNLSQEVWTQNAVTFLHIIQNAGYQTMNYNSTNLFDKYFLLEYMQEFDTWIAQYDVDYPTYPYTFSIWQYTDSGTVDGIDGNSTDMDIMFVKKEN